jgi:uncharacterized membrane protein YdjX (TVP38/TMEM64 family)
MISWAAVGVWLGLAFGPLIGVPVAPLYIAAGGVWGASALFWVATGVIVDLILAYKISRWLRPMIMKKLAKYQLPSVAELGEWTLVLVTRFTPGLPLSAQNYLLGVAGGQGGGFFLGSPGGQPVLGGGVLGVGGSVGEGERVFVATALGAIIILALITRVYVKRLTQKR